LTTSPEELRGQLRGLLAFPVTPFGDDRELDLARFREHLRYMIGATPHGLFVCGGTGEFYSLNVEEYRTLVRAAVEEAEGRLPVVAGVGYGARLAIDFARIAEDEGADGLLVMPPYLIKAEQEGLVQHYRAIASSTRLGLILYQRGNAIFTPQTASRLAEISNIMGLKDGHGDVENLTRISSAIGDRLLMMNGMPTAELSAKAFAGAGVYSYSSAIFNFAPEISWSFYKALTSEDSVQHDALLGGFFEPFAGLRDQKEGYNVSLIKAGMDAMGKAAGPVRSPLIEPSPAHKAELRSIIDRGMTLAQRESVGTEGETR
jgi:5-dehydro-4-deoxyglucarate dehydratase